MAAKAPPATSVLTQRLTRSSPSKANSKSTTVATVADDADDLARLPPPERSPTELLFGEEGTLRRDASFFALSLLTGTAARMFCFSPWVFGNYLLKNLGPVERDSVAWNWIVTARAIELAIGIAVWKCVDGQARKDGALFGVMIAMIARISLYAFEHAYFLLSTETVATLLFMDCFSIATAFSLLPTFLPHSIPSRPGLTAWKRLTTNPELIANVVFAVGLATTFGALTSFAVEHLGGTRLVKETVHNVTLPSVYVHGLSPAQRMENPTITIPALRSHLRPGRMSTHLLHALLEAIPLVPLASILPSLRARTIGASVFTLILTVSTLMLWDVLPIALEGALAVGTTLAVRGGAMASIVAWVLEELRMVVHEEIIDVVVVDEVTGEIEAVVEADVLVAEKANERSRL